MFQSLQTGSQVFAHGKGAKGAVSDVEIGEHLQLHHLVGDVEERLRIHLFGFSGPSLMFFFFSAFGGARHIAGGRRDRTGGAKITPVRFLGYFRTGEERRAKIRLEDGGDGCRKLPVGSVSDYRELLENDTDIEKLHQ